MVVIPELEAQAMRRATSITVATVPHLTLPISTVLAAAVLFLAMLPLSAARADVFRSVDAQGHVQYSDTPTPGAELVHISGQRVTITQPRPQPTPAAGSTGSTGNKPPGGATDGDPIHQQLEREAAARAVQADVSQTHAQQCKKATDTYNASIEAHRIYRTGADGERVLLSDDEVEKERLANKLAMDTACSGQ
jgi:hypothetical protein